MHFHFISENTDFKLKVYVTNSRFIVKSTLICFMIKLTIYYIHM